MARREARTRTTFVGSQAVSLVFAPFVLEVLDGPEKGKRHTCAERVLTLGSDPDAGLTLTEPMVSRRHAAIEVDEVGYRLDDLGSKNGLLLGSSRVRSAYLQAGDVVTCGRQRLRFDLDGGEAEVRLSAAGQLEGLIGGSRAMREVFALLERVAPSDATVLIEGETGTGKEFAAEALHKRSGRSGALHVFDCSAVAPNLVESELFGHVRGAFTGADRERLGAFRAAEGGTLFLDEIGELPSAQQPKLLRALEKREVRPVGSDQSAPFQARVVSATHRSLVREVEEGRFRSDLYYRLAVVRVRLPPLRERLEDLPDLVRAFLGPAAERVSFEAMARLGRHPWPGNVRELKNYVTRAMAIAGGDLDAAGPVEAVGAPASGAPAVDTSRPFKEAKEALIADFERRYWTELLRRCNGNVSEAARLADLHRKSAEYIVQKLGLRSEE